MAAVTVGFRWLDILEKEFDKAFVDLEVLVGDVCELEEEDVLKKAQQHLQALSSCFAQLTHKAQTIFQNNAKLEAELVHLRREACEGKAQLKVLKEKLDTLSIPQPPPEADPLSSDPKSSEIVVSQLTGIQNQLPEFIQAEEASQLQQENSALRRLVLGVQGELCGARLAAKYLDKELAGSLCTGCPEHTQEILTTLRSINTTCTETNLIVKGQRCERSTRMQFPSCLNLRPAKNLEELEKLINSGDLVERLAGAEKPSLQSTVRGMMKLLLTRELALRFSFTGMDSRRQTTKESFKSHAAYEMIIAALKLTKHFLVKRADVNRAVMNALKNVPDWEGFRDHRIRKPTATPKSSAASTSIDIKNDVEASGYSDDLIAETLKTIRTFTQERNMSQSPPASDVIGDAIRALNA